MLKSTRITIDISGDPLPDEFVAEVERSVKAIASAAGRPSLTPSISIVERYPMLTPREQQVLHLVSAGCSNKEAGQMLGISPRTIELHRTRLHKKLGARNAADLLRLVYTQT